MPNIITLKIENTAQFEALLEVFGQYVENTRIHVEECLEEGDDCATEASHLAVAEAYNDQLIRVLEQLAEAP